MRAFVARRPHAGRIGVLCLVVIALSGCQPGESAVLSPASTTPVASIPIPRPAPSNTHERVEQAYTEFWDVLGQAGRSTPDEAQSLLKPYATGSYLDHLVDGVRGMRRQGREPAGRVVPRVKEVWVSKDDAKVVDCQDVSGASLVESRTHRTLPTQGGDSANIEATLRRGKDGKWRLTGVTIKDKPCTAPS